MIPLHESCRHLVEAHHMDELHLVPVGSASPSLEEFPSPQHTTLVLYVSSMLFCYLLRYWFINLLFCKYIILLNRQRGPGFKAHRAARCMITLINAVVEALLYKAILN